MEKDREERKKKLASKTKDDPDGEPEVGTPSYPTSPVAGPSLLRHNGVWPLHHSHGVVSVLLSYIPDIDTHQELAVTVLYENFVYLQSFLSGAFLFRFVSSFTARPPPHSYVPRHHCARLHIW